MAGIEGASGTRGPAGGRAAVWIVFLVALALRLVSYHELLTPEGVRIWDSDAAYHLRRCRLALDTWPRVAGFEPLFNAPRGSPIPWPPVFDFLLATVARPITGAHPSPALLETVLAPIPPVLSAAVTFPAAAAARALAGTIGGTAFAAPAAVLAALAVALFPASIAYGHAGLVDHHGFAAALEAWLVALWILAAGDSLRRAGRSLRRVVVAGAVAGVALGTWVASLTVILAVELGLLAAWLLESPERGLRLSRLSVAFHLTAAAVTLPLALASPWWDAQPWSLVNLSRFHPVYLVLLALVSLLLSAPRGNGVGRRLAQASWRIGAVGLLGWFVVPGLRHAVLEALSWAGRENVFMAGVQESRRLVSFGGPGGIEIRPLLEDVGWAGFVLPLALIPLLLRGRRDALPERCLTAAWFIVTAVMAFSQRRFAASWAAPAAVVVGELASRWIPPGWPARAGPAAAAGDARAAVDAPGAPPRRGLGLGLPVAVLLILALFESSLRDAVSESTWLARALRGDPSPESVARWAPARELREALEVVRARLDPSEAVLSSWDHGHWIEYAAERPTVATNFGLYAGEDGFRDSARFLVTEDAGEARSILAAHGARAVLTTSHAVNGILAQLRILGRSPRDLFLFEGKRMTPRPAFQRCMLARLHLHDGAGGRRASPPAGKVTPGIRSDLPANALAGVLLGGIPWLRLVHESASRGLALGSPQPLVKVFEVVTGANLRGTARPGGIVTAAALVRLPSGRRLPVLYTARAGPDGAFTVRVPYPTEGLELLAPGGYRVTAAGGLRWRHVSVPAEAVSRGATLELGEPGEVR